MKRLAHLVIGANGAIGRALVNAMAQREPEKTIFAVARKHDIPFTHSNINSVTLPTSNEMAVQNWIAELNAQDMVFQTVICTIGILHGDVDGVEVSPEKKLEDLTSEKLLASFSVNTVMPAIWLKALVGAMDKNKSTIVCLSARVGSIQDNKLGGWYGYRASKAALNMILKTAAVEFARRSKNMVLISYHPGTVDSALSAPFQHNVPSDKLFTPAYTANQLLDYIDKATPEDSPYYIDWAHEAIPW